MNLQHGTHRCCRCPKLNHRALNGVLFLLPFTRTYSRLLYLLSPGPPGREDTLEIVHPPAMTHNCAGNGSKGGLKAPSKLELSPLPPVRRSPPGPPGQGHTLEIVHPPPMTHNCTGMAKGGPDAPLKLMLVPLPPVRRSSPGPPGQGHTLEIVHTPTRTRNCAGNG